MNEYPNVSILTPTYNRKRFIPLIAYNLQHMDYDKNKLEWCILDDGTEKMFETKEDLDKMKKSIYPIKINYVYNKNKKTIGVKRNLLVKQAKYKTCIMMDDDDIYFDSYIKHSVETLIMSKSGLVGTNHMVFIYPNHNYNISKIECDSKRQIHEATMCFTKKYFNSMPGFGKKGKGEGANMIDHNEKNTTYTNIFKCMICFCHSENSFNKEQFYKYKLNKKFNNSNYLDILKNISGIEYSDDYKSDEETE